MFPPWLRIQRFLPCCGNHCTRSIGRGKETFGAVWEPLGTAQTPSRAVSLLFQHNLLAQLLEQIPSPAGFVLHQSNPRVLCPKFSRKCTRFILSEHSEKLLVDILGREQTVEPGTQKDSLYFFLKIILLFFVTRLKLFDLYFTQNVYKMCGQIW